MRMKHSKEPWMALGSSIHDDNMVNVCVTNTSCDREFNEANAARIVACVNACAGLDNPEQIRSMYEQMKTGLYKLENNRIGRLMYERDELLKVARLASMRLLEIAKPTDDNLKLYSALLSAISNVEGGKQ